MTQNKLIKNSLIIIILTIIGKILAFVRDALIASKFGMSYATDIYMFSLGVVYLLTTISYGLTTTFIPIHSDFIEKKDKEERNRFVNNVTNVTTIYTTVIIVIGIVFAYFIVMIFAPGFKANPKVFSDSVYITRIMLLSLVFVSLQSVFTGVLQAHNEFFEPSAMATISNIVYIFYLVFFAKQFGIVGFAWATVLAFFAQFAINVPKYKMLGYGYRPVLDFKDESLKRLIILMIPVIISTSTAQLSLFANRFFATTIYEGAVSALDFANKLNSLVYEVFAVAISMVVYPSLSSFIAKDNKLEYKKSLIRAVNIILLIMVPAAVAMAILRVPIISIIFKRGAFDNNAVMITGSALLFYCPAMIAYGVRDLLNKAFYSIKDTKTPMVNSLIGVVINIVLNYILVRFMHVAGLTLATSISAIVTTLALIHILNRKINGLDIKSMCVTFAKILSASAFMGIFIWFINNIIIRYLGDTLKTNILIVAVSAVLGGTIYLVAISIFNVKEFKDLTSMARRKLLKDRNL